MIHLDTSFLVDLLREVHRATVGPARRKAAELATEELGVSIFVLCELEAGARAATSPARERARLAAVVAPLARILPTESMAELYGSILAGLRRQGAAIGTMDLLIAATAIAEGAPLVTRNRRHFARIPGLELIDY
ncbi:MAG: type II toxin-antitoxin system VapC family toxin [Thermoanaerobaculia bacterium]